MSGIGTPRRRASGAGLWQVAACDCVLTLAARIGYETKRLGGRAAALPAPTFGTGVAKSYDAACP